MNVAAFVAPTPRRDHRIVGGGRRAAWNVQSRGGGGSSVRQESMEQVRDADRGLVSHGAVADSYDISTMYEQKGRVNFCEVFAMR